MNAQRATLEIIAPTVEEAINKGLADLGLPREAVEVETLDEGSRGLFGIGARQARIRLVVKEAAGGEPQAVAVMEAAPAPAEPPVEAEPETAPAPAPEDDALRISRETVTELLDKMKVRAAVTARYGEPDEPKARIPVVVDIRGDDLSILIGKRSETLNALQYISGLIISKELGHSVPLVIDVEGYRTRREQQIRQLARRTAEQVIKTGRRLALEPMPANERRLVHMELRDHPDVTTQSTGEEPHRKVNIIPKK